MLEPNDEVEQLELVLLHESSLHLFQSMEDIVSRFCETNPITKKLPCLHLKVLGLRLVKFEVANRRLVSNLCRWMMKTRRLAGYSLEKCYVWWDCNDW